jgi:hypothetical protein
MMRRILGLLANNAACMRLVSEVVAGGRNQPGGPNTRGRGILII